MSCQDHKHLKKGSCDDCGRCRRCPPPPACRTPGKHIRDNVGAGSVRGASDRLGSAVENRESVRRSHARGNDRVDMRDNDSDVDVDADEPPNVFASTKERLQAVYSALGITATGSIQYIANTRIYGCNESHRGENRIFNIVSVVVERIFKLLCGADSKLLMQKFHDSKCSPRNENANLEKNLWALALDGNKDIAVITASIIAGSFSRSECKEKLRKAVEEHPSYPNINNLQLKEIGRKKYASLRKIFRDIKLGLPLPLYNYSYRVSPEKLASAVQYIQSNLQVKPGQSRSMTIGGNVLHGLPVYQRGGLSYADLHKDYKNSFPDELVLGQKTFRDIAAALTKKGEAKAGLSTYYIRFRNVGRRFEEMLERTLQFEYETPLQFTEVQTRLKFVLAEWKEMCQFLDYGYSWNHLDLSSRDKSHCCTYASGGRSNHEYDVSICSKCNMSYIFFETKVVSIMKVAKSYIVDADFKIEIDSMLSAFHFIQKTVIWYMSHKLRAKVQFLAIAKIKGVVKTDRSCVLIVMDHKQKILPQKYREGQVEYFGKKGMSLLGFMIVRGYIDGEESGYEYNFIDVVVEGYAGQNNTQVAAIIKVVKDYINTNFPDATSATIQSDNASCFSSQDLIPFIYFMNKDAGVKISKWIFTEAQTGKGRLDTHFSYLNLIMKAYVLEDNNIEKESDIFDALKFREGIKGSSALLLDASRLEGPTLGNKRKFKASTGSRSTHEVQWVGEEVHVIEASNISEPEVIKKRKLDTYTPNPLETSIKSEFMSAKGSLMIRHVKRVRIPSASNTPETPRPSQIALAASLGDLHTEVESRDHISGTAYGRSATSAPTLVHGWAKYPGNTRDKIPMACVQELIALYNQGVENKSRKVSAEKALDILTTKIIPNDWHARCTVTVGKIKAFFSLKPAKMRDLLVSHSEGIPEEIMTQQALDAADQQLLDQEIDEAAQIMPEASAADGL